MQSRWLCQTGPFAIAVAICTAGLSGCGATEDGAAFELGRMKVQLACEWECTSRPDCGNESWRVPDCAELCDRDEPHLECVPSWTAMYQCRTTRGYFCDQSVPTSTDLCRDEVLRLSECEAASNFKVRDACFEGCAKRAKCGETDEDRCRRGCVRLAADVLPACVGAATAFQVCVNASACIGENTITDRGSCEREESASRACLRSHLKCEGEKMDGTCPPVSCTCAGLQGTLVDAIIIGKSCRCPKDYDCPNIC